MFLIQYLARQSEYAVTRERLPSRSLNMVAESFVAASSYSSTEWKLEAIDKARSLLPIDAPFHVLATVAYRDSCLLRMQGQPQKSNARLELLDVSRIFTARDELQYQWIQLSRAHNMIA